MSVTILPQFVRLAFDELVEKYPDWYENDPLCLEHGYWLASTGGVKAIGENQFEVNHDLPNRKTFIVNRAAKACNCPGYVAKTQELGEPYSCPHRIAAYLFLRARTLQKQFDTEWQQFLRETCDGHPRREVPSDDVQEYLIALAESKAWHAAQERKAKANGDSRLSGQSNLESDRKGVE